MATPVVTTADLRDLFGGYDPSASEIQLALDRGALARRKVSRNWVYAGREEDLVDATEATIRVASELCSEWLLTPFYILSPSVRKQIDDVEISRAAADVLLREAANRGALVGYGLASADYQPYVALAAPDDSDELNRQVESMRELCAHPKRVAGRDLSAPARSRSGEAWKGSVLRHGEFLGLGSFADNQLVPWKLV